jgi:hypothetical protein
MKSGVLKCTKRLDFIFEIEYRNAVLSRGTLIHNSECPDSSPECPDKVSGVSGRIPEVSELLLPVRKTLWSGVSRPWCPEYPDIYLEYPGTLCQRLVFLWERYKYPIPPLSHSPSCSFRPELPTSKREPSHFPFTSFLSDFLRGFQWDCCKSKDLCK